MNVNFAGYREHVLTFERDKSVAVGDLVKMASSGKVTKVSDGDLFIGKCLAIRGDFAAIQVDGYIEETKFGKIDVGYNNLVAESVGVKTDSAGICKLVIYSDESTIGFIL